ncbi:hypothetical protein H0I31_08040 [Tenacibaculum sp. AHE15PA]|uniref:hypothetical protein n=1 Tax=Tenacibaculum TaxID=104267 RepID=UPI001C500DF6|nr:MULTISPECIES: hypothetical protein [Tenacibaculum]QXP74493.1 hypothetical protein H0I30_04925 [Tenacibaculum sp. AHE14PA]QXP75137.1 hypothetical protein H0I31_08040 [Tenacibaculum sp. AHE15PA]
MKTNLISISKSLLLTTAFASTLFISCESNDTIEDKTPTGTQEFYNVAFGVGSTGNSATFVQAFPELKEGSISFKGKGFEVPSVRTARIYGTPSGKFLYNLSYGGGILYKYEINGASNYTQLEETSVQVAMGTAYPRWKVLNEDDALVHAINTEKIYKDDVYTHTDAKAILQRIELADLSLAEKEEVAIPQTADGLHIWRIDNPTIQNGKAYYGVAKRGYDPNTDENIRTDEYKATTLVVDYPSLKNPVLLESEVAKGSTYGYRAPVYHVDEKGDIYHLTSNPAKLVRIKNGNYDDTYQLDLSTALGMTQVGANGWYYVGNGIAYAPYYDASIGSGSDKTTPWGVTRIDLYNNTAVKLNVPSNLWMWYYQSGVLGKDGKFHMAIAPLGEKGNIYSFDPKSTSPDGYTKGAELDNGADSFYIGIY